MNRTRAQRRWRRKGYTHEVVYRSSMGKSYHFIYVCQASFASYMRGHGTPDDWIRPICPQFIHNGRKPR